MNLFLIRHASATSGSAWPGDDESRPLTKGGRRKFALAAKAVATSGVARPDVILSSPLVRAVQTAQIFAEALSGAVPLIEDDRLGPEFGLDSLASLLAEYATLEGLAIVGHNPSFSDVLASVTGATGIEMSKGAIALVRLDDADAPAGQLLWLAPTELFAGV